MILDPTYPTQELFFQEITRTLQVELPSAAPTLIDCRDALERFLFRKALEEHQTVVLIIDEAHKLNALSLELLRVLLNYETNEAKLLQLVFLGQTELLPLLTGLPNVADRSSFKCTLKPLSLGDTREMIEFRLQEAGYRARTPLFTPEAIQHLYEYTEGYPRRIAMVCHQALRHLVMQKKPVADQAVVDELIHHELENGWSHPRRTGRLQQSSY